MKRKNNARPKDSKKYVLKSSSHAEIEHPHEHIANHVVAIVFISLFFLLGAFMFIIAEPSPTTGHAIVDLRGIDLELGIGEKISETIDSILDPEHRNELLFILYISWILIVGIVSLYYTERQLMG